MRSNAKGREAHSTGGRSAGVPRPAPFFLEFDQELRDLEHRGLIVRGAGDRIFLTPQGGRLAGRRA